MLGDDASFFAKKLADCLLCQPDRFVFQKYFDIYFSVVSGVEKEIWLLVGEIFLFMIFYPV